MGVKCLQRYMSEYWLTRGYSEEESIAKAKYHALARNSIEHLNNISKRKINYWLNQGYSEESAKLKVSEYQSKLGSNPVKKDTKPEREIINILSELNFTFVKQYPIKLSSKYIRVDFLLQDYNLIIEVFGDYWHLNPKIYSENDTIRSRKTAKDIWKSDSNRISELKSLGYSVLVIWESDIKLNKENVYEVIKKTISSK